MTTFFELKSRKEHERMTVGDPIDLGIVTTLRCNLGWFRLGLRVKELDFHTNDDIGVSWTRIHTLVLNAGVS
jgi:hypothetical protein